MAPGIEYLDEASSKLDAFIEMKLEPLPSRINKDELVSLFESGGFYRSYTLRLAVTGRDVQNESVRIKTSKIKNIPTASPPKRNKSPKEGEKAKLQESENVTEANEQLEIRPFPAN